MMRVVGPQCVYYAAVSIFILLVTVLHGVWCVVCGVGWGC